jgi:hypothetical protein
MYEENPHNRQLIPKEVERQKKNKARRRLERDGSAGSPGSTSDEEFVFRQLDSPPRTTPPATRAAPASVIAW